MVSSNSKQRQGECNKTPGHGACSTCGRPCYKGAPECGVLQRKLDRELGQRTHGLSRLGWRMAGMAWLGSTSLSKGGQWGSWGPRPLSEGRPVG